MINLSISDLDLHYGAAQALRGVSLEVKPGSITCVLGRNGTGKSSLLRAIMGLQPVSKADGQRCAEAIGALAFFECQTEGDDVADPLEQVFRDGVQKWHDVNEGTYSRYVNSKMSQ